MSLIAPHGRTWQRAQAFMEAGYASCVSAQDVPCLNADGIQRGKLVCMMSGQAAFVEPTAAAQCPLSTPVALKPPARQAPPTAAEAPRREKPPFLVR